MKSDHLATLIACILFTCHATANAAFDPNWFDFTGWDHETILTGGQTFPNIYQDIDVTVTGVGVNEVPSIFDGSNIRTGADTGSMNFNFSFTKTLDIIIDVQSLDLLESLAVTSTSTPTYTHNLGAMPGTSEAGVLAGSGFGFGSSGAARGIIEIDNISAFTWAYASSRDDKYEWFRVGTPISVPEPQSWTLVLMGAFAGLRPRRR